MYEIHYLGQPLKKITIAHGGVALEFATTKAQTRIRVGFPGDAYALCALLTVLGEDDMRMEIVEVKD